MARLEIVADDLTCSESVLVLALFNVGLFMLPHRGVLWTKMLRVLTICSLQSSLSFLRPDARSDARGNQQFDMNRIHYLALQCVFRTNGQPS